MKKALIVWGGWEGHEPKETSRTVAEALERRGFEVELSDSLDAFRDEEKLKALDLIVPSWTMGAIEKEQLLPVLRAVASGVGFGGWHGGMCDAFRQEVRWQFLCGGQWVAHPGGDGVRYTVRIVKEEASPITKGMDDFEVESEQYYLHVDPAVRVLALTDFDDVVMPVAWTTRWGLGRVFYTSLGHTNAIVSMPPVLEMLVRGLVWAAEGKEPARRGDVSARPMHADIERSF